MSAVVVLLLAALLSGSAGCGGVGSPTIGLPGQSPSKQDMLEMINVHRANLGLAQLTSHASLAQISQIQAEHQAERRSIGHIDGAGGRVNDRAAGVGYTFLSIGEIVGTASNTRLMFDNWLASPGHRERIEDPQYSQIGVGAASALGKQYWCVVLAQPL